MYINEIQKNTTNHGECGDIDKTKPDGERNPSHVYDMLGGEAKSLASSQPIFDHGHEQKNKNRNPLSLVHHQLNLNNVLPPPPHCLIRGLLAWTTVTLKYQP